MIWSRCCPPALLIELRRPCVQDKPEHSLFRSCIDRTQTRRKCYPLRDSSLIWEMELGAVSCYYKCVFRRRFRVCFLDLDFSLLGVWRRRRAAFMMKCVFLLWVACRQPSFSQGPMPSALLRRGRQMRSIWREGHRWSFAQSGRRDSASA